MRHLRVTDGDTDRFLIALAAALALHGALFLLIPRLDALRDESFDAPLYVALDPLPVADVEPASPPDIEPAPERPAPDEPLGNATPSDAAPSDAASAQSTNAVAPTAETPSPPRPDAPSAETSRVEPTFAPPPPPPPRTRVASDLRGDFASSQSATADTAFLEDQVRALYDWQERYRRDLEEWEAAQGPREPAGERASTQPAPTIDGAFERELDRLIDAIRSASANVVDAAASNDGDPAAASDTDPSQGDGIAVGDGDRRRIRIAGEPVALDAVALGAGFPTEYPVSVRFRVNAAGIVVSATVFPPTPEPDLDAAIVRAVRTWVFQPAPADSPVVDGSVTVIVETRAGR